MDDNQKTSKPKKVRHKSVLETLKDVGTSTTDSVKNLAKDTSKDFIRQLLGTQSPRKFSGEVSPGESLEMDEVFSGKREESVKLKKQIALERHLRQEEEKMSQERIGELRVQLQALTVEIQKLAHETSGLAEKTQIAAMQAPVEPGVYHIIFFEKLLEFIRSFREKVEEASVWLSVSNSRAQKKNYWAKYKKHGSKFLLSGEHYLTRSAG